MNQMLDLDLVDDLDRKLKMVSFEHQQPEFERQEAEAILDLYKAALGMA